MRTDSEGKGLTVLKLGGALLTEKRRPDSLRSDLLARVAREIGQAMDAGLIEALILVHGVGSFGHLPVIRHKLHHGLQSPGQLLPFSQTQTEVMRLRQAVARAMQDAGAPVAMLLPSSCMVSRDFQVQSQYFDAIAGFLRIGMVPLLGGDMLADATAGFSIYGGDALSVDLAMAFDADRLLFATDVDGVFDADPHQNPGARRVSSLSLTRMEAVTLGGKVLDVSGAMAGKLREIARARKLMAAGMEVRIFSMMNAGSLQAVLTGADQGTHIHP